MRVLINIDPKDALLAGSDTHGPQRISVGAGELSEAERSELAHYVLDGKDQAKRSAEFAVGWSLNRRGATVTVPYTWVEATLGSLCEWLAAAIDARRKADAEDAHCAAQAKARDAEAVDRLLAGAPANLINDQYHPYRVATSSAVDADPRFAAHLIEAKRICDEANAKQEAENERREEAKAEAERTADAERTAWIAEHGSERLMRLAAEGIEHWAVYRDERLGTERPGWHWHRKLPGDDQEARNAPLWALDLLDEARKVAPDADLVFWTVDEEYDYEADEQISEWTGYAAQAEFLYRKIVLFGNDSPV